MYRSAFIATGGRAHSHAVAYRKGVPSIRIVAASDLDPQRLKGFSEEFGVPATYTDYRRMLAEQKPDIVHLVTNPNVRSEAVRACAENGVKAVIVEKPMAISLSDARETERIARESGIKVVVNTQRRYFPSWEQLCQVVHSGDAGAVRFVRVQSASAVMCTGSHFIDMVQMLLRDPDPINVWSTAGVEEEYYCSHPGPGDFLTSITYPGRVQFLYEAAKYGAGIVGNDQYFMATEFNVIAERGHLWWTEANGWGYQLEGMSQAKRLPTNFMEDDPTGQAAFTEAVATWLDDPSKPHRNRLETAIRVFNIIAAMIQSATENRRVDFKPAELKDRTDALREKIRANEGTQPEQQSWAWKGPRG